MPVRTNSWIGFFLLLIITTGCKDPFEADIPGQDTGFLVVEGHINVGSNAVTTLKLSRTTKISESIRPKKELGATIAIEDEDLNRYPLVEKGNGVYSSAAFSLSTEQRFRVSILTADGKQYYSQFERSVITPAIDSLVWRRTNEGVGIYISTHDPYNATHYYQWDYEEVWEVRSPFFSFYQYVGGKVIPRPDAEISNMFKCWKYDYPNNLLTVSTATLSMDVVPMEQLILIPTGDEKISQQYAVTVSQTALSREAYEYLQLMEKNTNEVGTFSDPQPAELYGNIYCESSDEPVVGFIGACTTSQARIIIKKREVAEWDFRITCELIGVQNQPDSLAKYLSGGGPHGLIYIPVSSDGGSPPGSYTAAPEHCVDCRKRGGNNNKPDFWD